MSGLAGVSVVRASALTGNVLVLFDDAVLREDRLLVEGERALASALDGRGAQVDHEKRPYPSRTDKGRKPRLSHRVTASPEAVLAPGGPAWHAMEADEVATRLDVNPKEGLSPAVVAGRQARFGPNRLPEPARPSFMRLFLRQFANAPSALLAGGAIISVATGGLVDAVLIGAVLVANAAIGAGTERSGARAITALRRSFAIRARIRRDGKVSIVDAGELVPGDVIVLLPGDPVPADARLFFAHRLQVEESALTGESQPVDKETVPSPGRAPLATHPDMVYRGTTVVAGHGEAIVVATGGRTIVGRLRVLAAAAKTPPAPLEHDLDRLGRTLAVGALAVCSGVFGLSLLRGYTVAPAAATAVALGVAAIPEGLSAMATTVLALGSVRMRRKGTLIRTLGAAEALGSVTVVSADKTGTITENRMAARECYVEGQVVIIGGAADSATGIFALDGRAVAPKAIPGLLAALRVASLCNDAELERLNGEVVLTEGSATEGALLVAAVKAGLEPASLMAERPRVDRLDRGNGRRYMVTVHKEPTGRMAFAKGSPEDILALCTTIVKDGEETPLEEEDRNRLLAKNAEMAGRGLRVLALAERPLPVRYRAKDIAGGFIWRGLIGLVDPIRATVPAAIAALHRAGIRTVMITGDQARTAAAVARELSLSRSGSLRVLEAEDLAALAPETLRGLVQNVGIFARVPPEMKLAVVRALQANGEIVAMTGDGINDAPALRAADVGVAMGMRGTELARELADVVLSTDDFSRIVDAVEEGRLVRWNVKRVLHYLLATNATEVWTVAGAVAIGLPLPLTPLHLLWINLISDLGPAVGLATETAPTDLMAQPPRDPAEPIVPQSLWRQMLFESAAISLGALGAYGLGVLRHGAGPAARTMAFASLSTGQLLHVPLARSGARPVGLRNGRSNRVLALGMGTSALLTLGAVFFPPLRAALGGGSIGLGDLLISLGSSVLPIASIQGARMLQAPGQNDGRRRRVPVRRRTPVQETGIPDS